MHTHIFIRIHTYHIHIYHTHTYLHFHMYTHIQLYICVRVRVYTYSHTRTHIHFNQFSTIFWATHCNTMQCTAIHCNTLQYTATHCNTLQHAARKLVAHACQLSIIIQLLYIFECVVKICKCIRTCSYVCTQINMYMCWCARVCPLSHRHTLTCTQTHTHMHTDTDKWICVHTDTVVSEGNILMLCCSVLQCVA